MTFQHETHGPDEHDLPADARPTVGGPFGVLCDDISFKVDPDTGAKARRIAASRGQDLSKFMRDAFYREVTGKSYSMHMAEYLQSQESRGAREAAERAQNEFVLGPFGGGRA